LYLCFNLIWNRFRWFRWFWTMESSEWSRTENWVLARFAARTGLRGANYAGF